MLTIWLNYMVKQKKDSSTEQKILESARLVFVRDGMAGARMQDIADQAGINKALLHYYFRSKEKLFETIFLDAAEKIFPRMNAIFSSNKSLFQKIEDFCDTYISIIIGNPYLPLFVLTEINRDPVNFLDKIWPQYAKPDPRPFLLQIEKEVKQGIIKPINPIHLLVNMLSMCVFPFVGKPMLQHNLGIDDMQFRKLMEQRKKEVAAFIIDSIRK